jgi:hypothetical protein
VSTFYLLPPRESLEGLANEFASRLLPGLPVAEQFWERLLNELVDGREIFILHREDLAGEGDLASELTEEFGAEPGDQIIEVGSISLQRPSSVRVWQIQATVSDSRVA